MVENSGEACCALPRGPLGPIGRVQRSIGAAFLVAENSALATIASQQVFAFSGSLTFRFGMR